MNYKKKKCRRLFNKRTTGNHKKTSWDAKGGEPYNKPYNKYGKFEGYDYEV